MVSLDDAAALVLALPGVQEGPRHGHRAWSVGGKGFAWERPFSKADVKRFGAEPVPQGPILALVTEDLADKEAVLAAHPVAFFTIPHFNGYPAVLVHLASVDVDELREAILDAWLVHAPEAEARAYLARRAPGAPPTH